MAAKADCQKTHTGSSVVRAGYRFLLGFGLIYTAFLLSLLIPAVQNQVFYLNSVKVKSKVEQDEALLISEDSLFCRFNRSHISRLLLGPCQELLSARSYSCLAHQATHGDV